MNQQKVVDGTVVEETVVEGPIKLVERSPNEKMGLQGSLDDDMVNRKFELS